MAISVIAIFMNFLWGDRRCHERSVESRTEDGRPFLIGASRCESFYALAAAADASASLGEPDLPPVVLSLYRASRAIARGAR